MRVDYSTYHSAVIRCFIFLLLSLSSTIVKGQDKLALVIGNNNYSHEHKLNNAVSDAELIDSTLKILGFDVTFKKNIDNVDKMGLIFNQFARKLEEPKYSKVKIVFIYYSGHGVQGVNSNTETHNYLIPTKANIQCKKEVSSKAFNIQVFIWEKFRRNKTRAHILVLDACRNNTYLACSDSCGCTKTKGGTDGDNKFGNKFNATTGTLVAFSTKGGYTASDGIKGQNSIYAKSLAKHLLKQDITVDELFINVKSEVFNFYKEKGFEQSPQYNSELGNSTLKLYPSICGKNNSPVKQIISRANDSKEFTQAESIKFLDREAAYFEGLKTHSDAIKCKKAILDRYNYKFTNQGINANHLFLLFKQPDDVLALKDFDRKAFTIYTDALYYYLNRRDIEKHSEIKSNSILSYVDYVQYQSREFLKKINRSIKSAAAEHGDKPSRVEKETLKDIKEWSDNLAIAKKGTYKYSGLTGFIALSLEYQTLKEYSRHKKDYAAYENNEENDLPKRMTINDNNFSSEYYKDYDELINRLKEYKKSQSFNPSTFINNTDFFGKEMYNQIGIKDKVSFQIKLDNMIMGLLADFSSKESVEKGAKEFLQLASPYKKDIALGFNINKNIPLDFNIYSATLVKLLSASSFYANKDNNIKLRECLLELDSYLSSYTQYLEKLDSRVSSTSYIDRSSIKEELYILSDNHLVQSFIKEPFFKDNALKFIIDEYENDTILDVSSDLKLVIGEINLLSNSILMIKKLTDNERASSVRLDAYKTTVSQQAGLANLTLLQKKLTSKQLVNQKSKKLLKIFEKIKKSNFESLDSLEKQQVLKYTNTLIAEIVDKIRNDSSQIEEEFIQDIDGEVAKIKQRIEQNKEKQKKLELAKDKKFSNSEFIIEGINQEISEISKEIGNLGNQLERVELKKENIMYGHLNKPIGAAILRLYLDDLKASDSLFNKTKAIPQGQIQRMVDASNDMKLDSDIKNKFILYAYINKVLELSKQDNEITKDLMFKKIHLKTIIADKTQSYVWEFEDIVNDYQELYESYDNCGYHFQFKVNELLENENYSLKYHEKEVVKSQQLKLNNLLLKSE